MVNLQYTCSWRQSKIFKMEFQTIFLYFPLLLVCKSFPPFITSSSSSARKGLFPAAARVIIQTRPAAGEENGS